MDIQLKEKIKTIPHKPGCYLWKDKKGIVIYVGKAVDLNNRVKQYFLKDRDLKTRKLVNEIKDIDYVLVNNENESLLLESNLISEYKPKYNILLRESHTFPYIVVTKEQHPRILYTHEAKQKIKGTYYGPFALNNVKKYDLYNFINRIFPLRKCSKLPNKKCIYYDIGQCLGPCINKIEKKDYQPYLKEINDFFSGNLKKIDQKLADKEQSAAEKLMFEDCAKYLELRKNLKNFSNRQDIVFSQNNDEDIIGFHCKENVIAIVIFKYVNGTLLNKYDLITVFYCEIEEIMMRLVYEYYSKFAIELPKKVYLSLANQNLQMLSKNLNIEFINPEKGVKKEVMNNAVNNAIEIMKNKYLQVIANEIRETSALAELQKLLQLDNLNRIELFDNSNIYNVDRVAAMVVYENGVKKKNDYRKFNIKNTNANSDFEYMEEVIYRRYKKALETDGILPNLIIVDGGKPQISAALNSLRKLEIDSIVNLIGLAKNDKHKTDRIITSDYKEIMLDKKASLYFFLLSMQDEVHRFAISFFRQRRSKSLFSNSLYQIKNLGKKRIEKLLSKYETLEKIKEASVEELSQIVSVEIAHEIKKLK
ncbi:MAG: excinuclease ABC subunit UvrC [Malacoplasma sp.]|nr:excinuclease ABC subunit UvrC [Malacoplasma sp.]